MEAVRKAQRTDRWTERLCRALAMRVARRWVLISFRGQGGGEWRGIVDLLAIRKNTGRLDHPIRKAGDLFDIVLIQAKGGTASPPDAEDIKRLLSVKRYYRAKDIVYFHWREKDTCTFRRLYRGRWSVASARDIFGT
jgi:hypothetical protein